MNEESFHKVWMEWRVLGLPHADGEGGGGGRQAGGETGQQDQRVASAPQGQQGEHLHRAQR